LSTVRVALVADTHGYLNERVAEHVSGCDLVVHAGDVGGAGVLDRLGSRGAEVVAVRGNNDTAGRWPQSEQRVMEALPLEAELDLPGGVLVVVHGDRAGPASRRHGRLRRLFPRARAVVYGHSHRLNCDRGARPWILNPGACGRSRTYGGASCLILRAGPTRWSVQVFRVEPAPP